MTTKATKPARLVKTATRASTAKSRGAKPASPEARVLIESIRPSSDGSHWTLALSSGARVRVDSASAQSAGARVGAAWSNALARRVESARESQRMFARAMDHLARNGRATRTEIVRALGGDAAARATAAALVAHGWIPPK